MKSLVGTWQLVEFKYENEAQEMVSWGNHPTGLLIYTPDGYMSLSVNNEDDIFFYAGKYSVNSKSQVLHEITNASNPTRIGKQLIRNIQMNEDQLTLSSTGDEFGKGFITWRKL